MNNENFTDLLAPSTFKSVEVLGDLKAEVVATHPTRLEEPKPYDTMECTVTLRFTFTDPGLALVGFCLPSTSDTVNLDKDPANRAALEAWFGKAVWAGLYPEYNRQFRITRKADDE